MAKGDWLGIGGVTYDGFGRGLIEVREAGEGEAWSWRRLTDDEHAEILRHMSEWTKNRKSR